MVRAVWGKRLKRQPARPKLVSPVIRDAEMRGENHVWVPANTAEMGRHLRGEQLSTHVKLVPLKVARRIWQQVGDQAPDHGATLAAKHRELAAQVATLKEQRAAALTLLNEREATWNEAKEDMRKAVDTKGTRARQVVRWVAPMAVTAAMFGPAMFTMPALFGYAGVTTAGLAWAGVQRQSALWQLEDNLERMEHTDAYDRPLRRTRQRQRVRATASASTIEHIKRTLQWTPLFFTGTFAWATEMVMRLALRGKAVPVFNAGFVQKRDDFTDAKSDYEVVRNQYALALAAARGARVRELNHATAADRIRASVDRHAISEADLAAGVTPTFDEYRTAAPPPTESLAGQEGHEHDLDAWFSLRRSSDS